MKFRNYLPHDKQLQEGKLAPPVLPQFDDPVAVAPPVSEKNEVKLVNSEVVLVESAIIIFKPFLFRFTDFSLSERYFRTPF